MAGKYGYPYFANFINSDLDITDVRSMCPLDPQTEVLYRDDGGNVVRDNLKSIHMKWMTTWEQKPIDIITGDTTHPCRINKFFIPIMYDIVLENGAKISTTANHLNKTLRGDMIESRNLTLEDLIPTMEFEEEDYVYRWRKIQSITQRSIPDISGQRAISYCLEVLDDSEPIFMLANGIVTHNCRLRLDLDELRKRNGGLFGSGDSTGSVGVVTINLPRLGYMCQGNKPKFFKELTKVLEIARDSLEIKRAWLNENIIATRAIPAFCTYVGDFRNYFSTIGHIGDNELCENFFGEGIDILTERGKAFVIEVFEFIREQLLRFQQETGHLYNFEATPAEGCCHSLAKKDKEEFDDIITRGTEGAWYYTNSCHMPVNKITSIKQLYDHQNDLQYLHTGGCVIHTWLEGAITGSQAKAIIKDACMNYRNPYISLSPVNRYCPDHGYVKEHVDTCPACGKEVEKYQRITGYIRRVEFFNNGKKAEFAERAQLSVPS